MMNPYVLLAIVLAWAGSVGGAFFYGRNTGIDHAVAEQTEDAQLIEEAADAAQRAAAEEIAKIKQRVKEAQEARAAKAAGKPVIATESPKAAPFPLRPAQPKTTTGKPAKE